MKKLTLALLMVIFASNVWADTSKTVSIPGLSGVELSNYPYPAEIGLDDSMGGHPPSVTIPKKWKLVGVANGEKMNGNNLWFQDADGTVYLLHGFTTNGQFVIDKNVQKIVAK